MKKLLVLASLGVMTNVYAQSMLVNNEQLFNTVSPIEKITDKIISKSKVELTCGGVKFPEIYTVHKYADKVIDYKIELLEKNKTINTFNISSLENNYTPISVMQTQSYLSSVTKEHNQKFDKLKALNNKPGNSENQYRYYWKYQYKDLNTGLFIVLYPKLNGNNITTSMCFEKSELVDMKKTNFTDETDSLDDAVLDFPEFKNASALNQIKTTSGETIKLNINEDISIKMTATVRK